MKKFCVFIFCACLCAVSFAEIKLDGIVWQKSLRAGKGPKIKFEDVSSLHFLENDFSKTQIRIKLRISNKEQKAVSGVVLNCAFSARITGGKNNVSVWSVPFAVDERRIAKLKPGQTLDIAVPHTGLNAFLAKYKNSVFKITALRAEIMLEPKQGYNLKNLFISSEIVVLQD